MYMCAEIGSHKTSTILLISVIFFFAFRLVGDNVDLSTTAHVQTLEQTNQSLHWFHEYAVKDRVALPSGDNRPQKSLDELSMEEILPTGAVQEETIMDLMYIIPRILCRYLPAYSIFQSPLCITSHTLILKKWHRGQKRYILNMRMSTLI